jgi:hypothetical protein
MDQDRDQWRAAVYTVINLVVAVTKLHASRSQKNHKTLQHVQRSRGE